MRMSLFLALLVAPAPVQDAQRVLDKYRAVRPLPDDLAVYRHDWAPSLKEAKERAAKEQRPILLIVVTNSYGDMYSGHC